MGLGYCHQAVGDILPNNDLHPIRCCAVRCLQARCKRGQMCNLPMPSTCHCRHCRNTVVVLLFLQYYSVLLSIISTCHCRHCRNTVAVLLYLQFSAAIECSVKCATTCPHQFLLIKHLITAVNTVLLGLLDWQSRELFGIRNLCNSLGLPIYGSTPGECQNNPSCQ